MVTQERVKVWLRATRPFTLTASVVPVLVGTAAAASTSFDFAVFLLAIFGSIFIQIGTNFVNEYFDYVQGLDDEASLGPAGVILRGLLSPPAVLIGSIVTFGAGAACGLVIAWIVGWPVLAIGIASLLSAYFYAAKPLALGYRGLGEVQVFAFMGVLMVLASHYIQTEEWAWEALWLSLPVGCLVTAILHANHTRDLDQDKARGRITHAIVLGRQGASHEYLLLAGGAYLALSVVVATGVASPLTLLAFLTAPKAGGLVSLVYGEMRPQYLNALVRGTAELHGQFGLLLALGLALAAWQE